jgi:hypothetical protein
MEINLKDCIRNWIIWKKLVENAKTSLKKKKKKKTTTTTTTTTTMDG